MSAEQKVPDGFCCLEEYRSRLLRDAADLLQTINFVGLRDRVRAAVEAERWREHALSLHAPMSVNGVRVLANLLSEQADEGVCRASSLSLFDIADKLDQAPAAPRGCTGSKKGGRS